MTQTAAARVSVIGILGLGFLSDFEIRISDLELLVTLSLRSRIFLTLAPLLVLVGEDEALAEETRLLVARARASGTEARLLVGEGMQHDWPLTLPWLPESRRAWADIAAFIEDRACTRTFEGGVS